jgi:hypothetical protein
MSDQVIETLMARFRDAGDAPALAYQGGVKNFLWLVEQIDEVTDWLSKAGVTQGQTVMLTSDYTPKTVAICLDL